MQTFLPYANFKKSAKVLDNKRLGKQRVEAWQIYNVLQKKKERQRGYADFLVKYGKLNIAWENHPAVKMWENYEMALLDYGIAICLEWKARGFKDTMLERFEKEFDKLRVGKKIFFLPEWFGKKSFHDSHKSNLLRKDILYYSKNRWKTGINLDYVWPI